MDKVQYIDSFCSSLQQMFVRLTCWQFVDISCSWSRHHCYKLGTPPPHQHLLLHPCWEPTVMWPVCRSTPNLMPIPQLDDRSRCWSKFSQVITPLTVWWLDSECLSAPSGSRCIVGDTGWIRVIEAWSRKCCGIRTCLCGMTRTCSWLVIELSHIHKTSWLTLVKWIIFLVHEFVTR